jgi:fructokinase
LFGLSPEEGATHILEHYGVKLVFVTCGADGCFFKNAVASGHVPSLVGVNVVDTTGAGDIFGGSAVWGVLNSEKSPETLDEEELRSIVWRACVTAGLSTEKHGGISSSPTVQDVQNKLK